MISGMLMRARQHGFAVAPSVFFIGFLCDFQLLEQRTLLAISLLDSQNKRMDQAGWITASAGISHLASIVVQGVFLLQLARPLFDWTVRKVAQMRMIEEKKQQKRDQLDGYQVEAQKLQETLAAPESDVEEIKATVAALVRNYLVCAKDIDRFDSGIVDQAKLLAYAIRKALNQLVKKIEPKSENEIVGNSAYKCLGNFGIRIAELNRIAQATCGLEQDDGLTLRLKMAASGIFSKKDLVTLFEGCQQSHYREAKLIEKLGRQGNWNVLARLPLPFIKNIIQNNARAVATGLALGFHVIAFLQLYASLRVCIQDRKHWVPFVRETALPVADFLYDAYHHTAPRVSVSDFIVGGLVDRCIWLAGVQSVPLGGFVYAVAMTCWEDRFTLSSFGRYLKDVYWGWLSIDQLAQH